MNLRKHLAAGLTAALLLGGFSLLPAQVVKQAGKQVPRALSQNAGAVSVSAWKHFKGAIPASAAAHQAAPAASLKTKLARKYPGLVVQYERSINQRPLQQALRRAVELRGLSPSKGWVKTMPHSITVSSLDGLTLDGYTQVPPPMPIPTNNIYLYRGMGLNEAALRNVLINGLRPQDTGSSANAVGTQMRLLNMGTMPVSQEMLRDLQIKQTYLTHLSQETTHYAYLNSFKEGRIPVVVTVRGWRKGNYHHVIAEDIPSSDFVEVSVLIQGPQGTPVWCRAQLAKDGHSFVFTPYAPK